MARSKHAVPHWLRELGYDGKITPEQAARWKAQGGRKFMMDGRISDLCFEGCMPDCAIMLVLDDEEARWLADRLDDAAEALDDAE